MTTTAPLVQIAQATLEDVAAIRRVAELTWPDTFGAILSPEELATALETSYAEAHLASLIESGQEHFWVLRLDHQVVGYASVSQNMQALTSLSPVPELALKAGKVSSYKLEKLYCLPQSHGKGLGRLLLEAAESFTRNQDVQSLHLLVNRANPAVGFYQARGFETVGELNQWYEGIYREDFVMLKDLEKQAHVA